MDNYQSKPSVLNKGAIKLTKLCLNLVNIGNNINRRDK